MKTLGTALIAASLLLTGCTGGSDEKEPDQSGAGSATTEEPPEATKAAPPRAIDEIPTTTPTRVWRSELRTFGQPHVVVDTVVVLAIARGQEIDIRGLDLRTGKQRWSYPFSPSEQASSPFIEPLSFVSDGGDEYAVFQNPGTGIGPGSSYRMPFVAVDVASGKVRARTRPFEASWPAVPCRDDVDVCLADAGAQDPTAKIRWDLSSLELRPEEDPLPRLAGSEAEGGLYTGGNSPSIASYLGRVDERGRRVWQTRTPDLMGKGWQYQYGGGGAAYHEDEGVFVIGIRKEVPEAQNRRYRQGKEAVLDQSVRRLVALDVDDGEPVWTYDGADFGCDEFVSDEAPVRCAVRGDAVYRRDWDEPRYRKVEVVVEGYDPATGEPTWSQPLSRKKSQAVVESLVPTVSGGGDAFVDATDVRVAETPEGKALLSLLDGSSVLLRRSDRMICADGDVAFEYPGDDSTFFGRDRGSLHHSCTREGERVPGVPSAYGLYQGAEAAGEGVFLMATANDVQAFRVPPE